MIRRAPVASLVVSAALLVGIAVYEGYADVAAPPVPGDVPTVGFGSAGPDVRLGDTTDPVRALVRLAADADRFAQAVKRCAPVPLYPHEFDAYVSLAYNIGEGAFCRSTLAKKLTAGDYAGACAEILRWNKFKGRPLAGLTARRQSEYRQCIGRSS